MSVCVCETFLDVLTGKHADVKDETHTQSSLHVHVYEKKLSNESNPMLTEMNVVSKQ